MHQMIFFSLNFFFFSVITFFSGLYLSLTGEVIFVDWSIMTLGGIPVSLTLIFDMVSLLFSCTVFFISGNVCWFAVGYMGGEVYVKRFSYLVFFFVVSMNMLIFSGNLITVLLGWDGLGLTSFLLVIYYQNSYSLGAGLITVLTNRLGDVGLILSIGLLLDGGHWVISELQSSSFIAFLVVLGAITKSAQYPFSSWLPMAMAAPTPVSALVHSSTLVTAGIYILIRFFPVISAFEGVSSLLLLLSSLTMVLAGLAAFTEMDFKKIIAYSTLSQLGVMVMALGLGSPYLSFFHLLSHAMFKALMFICAGVYIYYHKHGQDLRVMGNLAYYFPVVQLGLIVSNLALCGFPFLSGFYSKDPIYEMSAGGFYNLVVVFFMVFGLFLTVVYSIRAMLLSQMGPSNQTSLNCFNNNFSFYKLPVVLLGLFAISWGAVLNWVLLPPVVISPVSFILGVLPFTSFIFFSFIYMNWCFSVSCYGVVNKKKLSGVSMLQEGLVSLWFLSSISSQYVIKDVAYFGGKFVTVVEQGWMEEISGQGVMSLSLRVSSAISSINSSVITLLMLIGVVVGVISYSA